MLTQGSNRIDENWYTETQRQKEREIGGKGRESEMIDKDRQREMEDSEIYVPISPALNEIILGKQRKM